MDKYILNKDNTILLIIDIQERLAPVMENKEGIISNTNILIETAKQMNMPIIVTEQYPKGIGHTVTEIKDNLVNEKLFEKISFSAYIDDIKDAIKQTGRTKVIITGIETHICVFQTARDLISDGYEVFVSRDAVSSRVKENYINGLHLMKEMGAVITNTESIVFDLLKKAGTPEFKVLSKLIK